MSEGWPRGEEDVDLAGHAPDGGAHVESDNQPDNHRAGQVGWLMYEWANQPYFSLITIFLFANYFANVFYPGDEATGQAYWGYTQAIAGVVIALMSPVLGAMACWPKTSATTPPAVSKCCATRCRSALGAKKFAGTGTRAGAI